MTTEKPIDFDQHLLPIGYELQEFVIKKHLGQGGFGVTYLAMDESFDRLVVLKEYLPVGIAVRHQGQTVAPATSGTNEDYLWGLQRFKEEAQTLARFGHKNIVTVRRVFPANGTAYMVMDYLSGGCLDDRLKTGQQYSEATFKPILQDIISGLQVVHSHDYLHRDIAPDNIMFDDQDNPVLIDFGAARMAVSGRSKPLSAIVKEGYAPIEQYNEKSPQGPYTDIYALSAVCYEVIKGERPPESTVRIDADHDPVSPLAEQPMAGWSSDFLAAIDAGLALRRQDRPQTLDDWIALMDGTAGEHDDKLIQMIKNAWADGVMTAQERQNLYLAAEAFGRAPLWVDEKINIYKPASATSDTGQQDQGQSQKSGSGALKAAVIALVLAGGGFLSYDYYDRKQQELLRDKTAFDHAQQMNSEKSFTDYLREFPDGKHRSKAQARLNSLRADARAYQIAAKNNTEASYDQYLKKYPSGIHAAEAKVARGALASKRLDKTAYNQAVQKNTITAYNNYLRDYPSGMYRTSANRKKRALEKTKKDNNAFKRAGDTHTEASYTGYLNKYPYGIHAKTARKYRDRMRADKRLRDNDKKKKLGEAERKAYFAAKTVDEYKQFVRSYPNSARADNAMYTIAYRYANGTKVAKNYADARYWYNRAARKGHVMAMNNLGVIYDMGRGIKADKKLAFDWFLRAAEGGNSVAMSNVGLFYRYGRAGTKNEKRALSWYLKSAEKGYSRAMYEAGLMYEYGRGTDKSYASALYWYRKSAEKNYKSAMRALGRMYEKGIGVPKNAATSKSWYDKAKATK